MPRTCPVQKFKHCQQSGAQQSTHGGAGGALSGGSKYIERLLMPVNTPVVRQLLHESIEALVEVYYDPQLYPAAKDATSEAMDFAAKIDTMPHNTALAVFFLLLNADATLKSRIAQQEFNKRKLTRFLRDLNKYAVNPFLNSETMTLSDFVYRCEELYILA